ncbi:uncharacterized protein J3R85_001821 [Psidium guajava]|nr:uncharacterized protein J3R85_001821 [Psidium guajava]
MEGDEVPEPVCKTLQIQDFDQPRLVPLGFRYYHLEVEVEFVYLLPNTASRFSAQAIVHTSKQDKRVFLVDADSLLHDPMAKHMVGNLLGEMGVPFHGDREFMVEKVLSCAIAMASDERNRDLGVLPMGVFISCVDPLNDEEWWVTVEGLEKVAIAGKPMHCTICATEISVGSRGARMLCSHVYHGDCIVGWLENCAGCPVCMSELP